MFVNQNLVAQDFFQQDFDTGKQYILLAHPTVHNLETIIYLSSNSIFKIPENTVFVGIYSADESYDFQQSIDFVAKEKIKDIHFQAIKGFIDVGDVYKENKATDQYRLIFENSLGIILFGGPDLVPAIYFEANNKSVVTDPHRHTFETSLVFHLLGGTRNPEFQPFLDENPNYVVTGFCLGMQTMNVATGGTMVQDIPFEVYEKVQEQKVVQLKRNQLHRNYWHKISTDSLLMSINFHSLKLSGSEFFREEVGYHCLFPPKILSSHHQAVENLTDCWSVTTYSRDKKVIEGIRHKEYKNVFAVQFHPEVPALYENRKALKFKPSDKPKTYHEIIGKRGLKFHRKYWDFVSTAFKSASGLSE